MRNRGNVTRAAALGMVGAAALGFWLGRGGLQHAAFAAPPTQAPATAPAAAPASDYSQRVVAYINGNTPITREDLGEYLIARQGTDKLELLVNKRIIETAAQKAGFDVTAAEIDAAIDRDLGVMGNVKRGEFIARVLKQYNKTLYEWKEDVIRPRLMLEKMVKAQIKVTDDELQKAFQAQYGPKVECRIIIWPGKDQHRFALQSYEKIRTNEEEFNRAACTQAISHLAAVGGRIQPVAHNSGVHPEVEQQAFMLKPGEVSRLIITPEGTVCIKVDRQVAAEDKVKFDDVRKDLDKLCFDTKVTREIPEVMKRLRDEAKPVFILKKPQTQQELEQEVQAELLQTGGPIRK